MVLSFLGQKVTVEGGVLAHPCPPCAFWESGGKEGMVRARQAGHIHSSRPQSVTPAITIPMPHGRTQELFRLAAHSSALARMHTDAQTDYTVVIELREQSC